MGMPDSQLTRSEFLYAAGSAKCGRRTSAAKAAFRETLTIAALKRCATQNRIPRGIVSQRIENDLTGTGFAGLQEGPNHVIPQYDVLHTSLFCLPQC